jgi:hypothetical protein
MASINAPQLTYGVARTTEFFEDINHSRHPIFRCPEALWMWRGLSPAERSRGVAWRSSRIERRDVLRGVVKAEEAAQKQYVWREPDTDQWVVKDSVD